MALSGIQIYKLLPQTNCKECGFPTCLAFAMKLAAKQVELSACPYVSEASKKQLAESSAPPIRLITLKSDGREVKVGNEVCMYRHEKTFYNRPGLFLRIKASDPDLAKKVATADAYKVNYVGMDFSLDGFAIEADADLPAAVKAVREVTKRPLILIGSDPAALDSSLSLLAGEATLIYAADSSNYEALADVAKKHKAALVVKGDSLDALADLTPKVQAKGVEDMVLDLGGKNLGRVVNSLHPGAPPGSQSQLQALGLSDHFLRRPKRAGQGSRICCAGDCQIRWLRGDRHLRARVGLSFAGPAREYLHRPAETDPGSAWCVRNQFAQAR